MDESLFGFFNFNAPNPSNNNELDEGAKQTKALYDAYVRAGFSPGQAYGFLYAVFIGLGQGMNKK